MLLDILSQSRSYFQYAYISLNVQHIYSSTVNSPKIISEVVNTYLLSIQSPSEKSLTFESAPPAAKSCI